MRVTSPRIIWFEILRGLKGGLKLSLVVAVLSGAGWGARIGMQSFFIDNEEFQLQEIELETNGKIMEADVAEVAGLDPEASVLALSLSEVRRKLEARPGIVTAVVSRRLPGTLRVAIEERIPVAWLECPLIGALAKDPGTGILLDADGVCFRCDPWLTEAARGLPVVMLSEASEGDVVENRPLRHREGRRALHLLQLSERTLGEAGWSLQVVAVQNECALLAATSEGVWVTFGMDHDERQIRDLVTLRNYALQNQQNLAATNLIPERNTPARFMDAPQGENGMWLAPGTRLERDIEAILKRD